MELYGVVLFLHIAVILVAFGLAGAIHVSEWLTARASTVQEMRTVVKPQAWGVLFAPVVALMLLLGGWLVKLSEDRRDEYSFGDGWVWTGALVLVIAAVAGFAVEGPHVERLSKALEQAPEGPVTPALRQLATTRFPLVLGHAVPLMILGVVANMVNKPGTAVSILVIAIGAVLGSLLGLVAARGPAPATTTTPSP